MMNPKVNDKALELADVAGFSEHHTGGGTMAFMCSGDDTYWLITADNDHIDADPDDPVWTVGRYAGDDESSPDAEYLWTYVEEEITLHQALEVFKSIPKPIENENTVEKWSDIGVELTANTVQPNP